MIKIYVYSKETGCLEYIDTGQPDFVIKDLPEGCDFTLEPYPVGIGKYRWNGSKWIKANEQSKAR